MDKNIQDQKQIYLDHLILMDRFKEYASPKSKMTQMIRAGKLIKIRRGLYIDSQVNSYSIKTLANLICFPSYISFEYALSYYNMIPERVEIITSASFQKNKNKIFHTPVGTFFYRYLEPSIFHYGLNRLEENGNPFLIASREKALLDTLSKIKGVRSIKEIQALILDDLRLDKDILQDLDKNELSFLSIKYHQRNGRMLVKWLESRINE